MRRVVFAALLFGMPLRPSLSQTLPPLKGSVDRVKVHAAALEGNLEGDSADRDVSVYLPPSYRTAPPRSICGGAAAPRRSDGIRSSTFFTALPIPRTVGSAFLRIS